VVNDGSSDDTYGACMEVQLAYPKVLRLVNLEKNYGQRIATLLGIYVAKSRYVVTFDDDLQYAIQDIMKLYHKIYGSEDWVVTAHYKYSSPKILHGLGSRIALFMLNYFFFPHYKRTKYYTSFKIFDKAVLLENRVENVYHFWEIPPSKIKSIKVNKANRIAGKSSYYFFASFVTLLPVVVKCLIKISIYWIAPLLLLLFLLSTTSILPMLILLTLLVAMIIFLQANKESYKNIKIKKI
jgi:glycosyltransferase involved in cell wall biosynthesis